MRLLVVEDDPTISHFLVNREGGTIRVQGDAWEAGRVCASTDAGTTFELMLPGQRQR